MTALTALTGLFLIAFLAATIFPAQSEAALIALLLAGTYDPTALVVVAGLGNTLGAVVNYYLGRYVHTFQHRRWFPVKPEQLAKTERWYHKYGRWSLLLSWAPFIGDPLTVIAGVLREPLWSFLILVAMAKFGRYATLTLITLYWT